MLTTTVAVNRSLLAAPSLALDGSPQLARHWTLLPSAHSYSSLLDQVIPSTVNLLDENAGLAEPDPLKFSINGDSWLWNRWSLDGVDISDPLLSGAPALLPPFRAVQGLSVADPSLATRRGAGGIELYLALPELPEGSVMGASYQIGRVGDLVPVAHGLMAATSGSHNRDRSGRPTALRRQALHPFRTYGISAATSKRLQVGQAFNLAAGTRRFVEFAPIFEPDSLASPAVGVYDEQHLRMSAALRLQPHERDWQSTLLVEYFEREHYGAELYRSPDETAALQTVTLLPTFVFDGWSLGALLKFYELSANNLTFTKDFADPDGQELNPWQASGRYTAVGAYARYERPFFYASLDEDILMFRPAQTAWSNALTLRDLPYGRIDWQVSNNSIASGNLRLGTASEFMPRRAVFAYDAYLISLHGFNSGGDNQLGLVDLGASFKFVFPLRPRVRPFLYLAKTPLPLDSQLLQKLNPDHLNGQVYLDRGGDVLIDTWGGESLHLQGSLRPANALALALGFDKRWNDTWSGLLQGIVKAYRNTYELKFAADPASYGYAVSGVYYLAPGAKEYVLTNRSTVPVYYGLQMQILGDASDRYLFSWSFAAYNVIGRSPFGNGPTANDIGVVDFSSANPNSDVKGQANLDADRAFNTKILTGTKIYRGLWWMSTLTHYDGTPFAPYALHSHNGQPARTYAEFRGSPYTFVGPLKGRREDYRLNMDLQLQYTAELRRAQLRVWWLMANLLDLSNEIAEVQSDAGLAGRVALEQEPPRAFEFGLEVLAF